MKVFAFQPFFRRVAFFVGMPGIVAVAIVVMLEAKPTPPASVIDAPLRSSLASLPEALGDWTRATDAEGEPIADARYHFDGLEACLGTDVYLDRNVARDARSVRVHVGYHSGATLRNAQCTPERCWDAGGNRLVSPALRVQLSTGLEVMLVEFEQDPQGSRRLAAWTFLVDGERSAEHDAPGLATSHWTQVQLEGHFSPEEATTARRIFLADVEDLMPCVVSELQDACLPLPVAALPTG